MKKISIFIGILFIFNLKAMANNNDICIDKNNLQMEELVNLSKLEKDRNKYINYWQGIKYKYNKSGNINEQKAIESFKEDLKLNPDNIDSYKQLSELYERLSKIDDLIKLYENFKENNPQSLYFHSLLAKAYIQKGKNLEFNNLIDEMYKKQPNDINTYLMISVIYSSINNHKEGINILQKAKIKFPNCKKDLLQLLSFFYIKNKEYDNAINEANELIKLYPKDHNGYQIMSVIYLESGNTEKANKYISEANKLKTNNEDKIKGNDYDKTRQELLPTDEQIKRLKKDENKK